MKLFQILMAALLLVFAGSALGGVTIVNLEEGDTVNAKTFTIVAKAEGLCAPGRHMTHIIGVTNNWTGEVTEAFVTAGGTSSMYGLEVIMPKPSRIYSLCDNGKWTIVARVGEIAAPDTSLTLRIEVKNDFTGEVAEEFINVVTK